MGASAATTRRGARGASSRSVSDIHTARLKRLRAELRSRSLDALLVTNPKDVFYLTGFHGEDSWVVVSGRRVVLLSDFRFQEELEATRGVTIVIRSGAILEASIPILIDHAALGVQGEFMTIEVRSSLARAIGARPLRDTRGLVGSLRILKDAAEVAQIKKAIAIQQKAFRDTLEGMTPGVREVEIAGELELRMKRLGGEGASFPIIAAARANGSRPHYRPGRCKTATHQPLLIDWGCIAGGYCSDMTRTITFGRWPKPLAEVYAIVLEAQQSAIEAIAPGRRCGEIDAIARDVITKHGFGEQFGHGLGHGIGLDIHEAPRLNRHSTDVLKPGMVVTIEPGVYLPGIGGIRLEDDVLVTERGGDRLCRLPNELHWATR